MQDRSVDRVIGPLASHMSGFNEFLMARGYSPHALDLQVRLAGDVSGWLEREGLGVDAFGPADVAAFIADRRRVPRPLSSSRALRPLFVYLMSVGCSPTVVAEEGAAAELLADYRRYLIGERSLGSLTVLGYMQTATVFVSEWVGDAARPVAELGAADVSAFVRRCAVGRSPRTVNEIVVRLRSLLRFLYVKGKIVAPLDQAALGMACWRAGALPKALPAGVVERILASCDRTTLVGARDFAMIVVLARLGLRAGEVAVIEVGDVDWRAGELVVRGKGGCRDVLPLPVDVGEALVGYLERRGPSRGCRQLFLHVVAPYAGVAMTDVRAAVRRACWRADLTDTGAHRFRHSVATDMLAAGAPLHEIGQVLRHRDVETTALYAKVDRAALAAVVSALAWERGMSALADAATEYLVLRRVVGFKLEGADKVLADFAGFAESQGTERVTVALAMRWAEAANSASGCTRRMVTLRCFARWFQALDPTSEVPPAGLLAGTKRRRPPFLYSPREIVSLMAAARRLEPRLWAATHETVIGLLAATGMRIGETLRLDLRDVALDDATVTIWHTKFNKNRLVPLDPTTVDALAAYQRLRRQTRTHTPAMFVTPGGERLTHGQVNHVFVRLLTSAGIASPPGARRPWVHDLRHTFAVATMLAWYRDGADVQALLPRLSTYLGHVDPASTYWYLSAAPELLTLAAERLELGPGGPS